MEYNGGIRELSPGDSLAESRSFRLVLGSPGGVGRRKFRKDTRGIDRQAEPMLEGTEFQGWRRL